jgi:death-on-curing family protein
VAARPRRIRDIADEAEIDYDEALVTLWDRGLEEFEDPDDVVPARKLNEVQRALGLASLRQLRSIEFWLRQTGLTRDQFAKELADRGITITSTARNLPKGALRRVRKTFRAFEDTSPLSDEVDDSKDGVNEPFEWRIIGHRRQMCYLTEDQVEAIHQTLVNDFKESSDPISPPGIRDRNLFSSAVHRPIMAEEKYPTVELAGAALMHSLIHNHPFHNGNKRSALVTLLVFLDENGFLLTTNEDGLFRFTLRVAQHRLVKRGASDFADQEVQTIASWIKDNVRPIEKSQRPIKWVRLERILRRNGCSFEHPKSGNRIDITRTVVRRTGILKREREVTLRAQAGRAGPGDEADRNTIAHIRSKLELDEAHGIDSAAFEEGLAPAEFIVTYRKTLQRLAKL